jgi:DNA recombination protein RmuC
MVEIAVILLALAAIGGIAVVARWLVQTVHAELTTFKAETATQFAERNADVDRRLEGMTATLDRRLETASQAATQIHGQLGELRQANAEMLASAGELRKIGDVLRPPKARGGFGELLLANLLRDRLPRDAYELQYGFAGGERVDAIIRVERLVPIDAKFPLDNFERLADAETDADRTLFEKAFSRDLKIHVDAIAGKYIRPDEGTYDFALMYLPSEGVYYELVCGKTGALLQYAHEKRVFPVSPTTFTSQLQVIALGLKGMQIEQRAHEVMAYVAQLQGDFDRFRDDFQVVGKHIGNAQSKFAEAEKRLDRFDTKLERAVETEAEVPAAAVAQELPRALDAA